MPAVRRLAAILAADVAGYSRLMGADEEGTHERLMAHHRELVHPKIAGHHGRIVKTDPDPKLDPLLRWDVGISLGHPPLELDRTADRVNDACEFHQHPIAGRI